MASQSRLDIIEADDREETDSSYGSIDDGSYTTSITSSILNYKYQNGRRYHTFREGAYVLPNDEDEQNRMDLLHHIYQVVLGGDLHRAPIKDPRKVLDLGTGTGSWAIDFADMHPGAEVTGNDLSPIQPRWTPPNCKFEVDDFQDEWPASRTFDFIHAREMEGSVGDYDKLFAQAYKQLRPGGYLEMQNFVMEFFSDDGTLGKAESLSKWCRLVLEAARAIGKDMYTSPTWEDKMKLAGFKNVTADIYKLPMGVWPKDPKLKELGWYQQAQFLEGVKSYTPGLLINVLGWRQEEAEVLMAEVRRDVTNPSVHVYAKMLFLHGQKA